MRKGTLPAVAGNPPADAAQPSGIKGIIVTVIMNVTHEPSAPRIPNFLFLNPKNKSAPINHSETPKNQLAPRQPNTGPIQAIRGPLLIPPPRTPSMHELSGGHLEKYLFRAACKSDSKN